jgi:hypothetical protein
MKWEEIMKIHIKHILTQVTRQTCQKLCCMSLEMDIFNNSVDKKNGQQRKHSVGIYKQYTSWLFSKNMYFTEIIKMGMKVT